MCIGTVRGALIKLGICQSPSEVEIREAETDNLIVDRERTMSELVQHSATFKEKSEHIEAVTEQRKDDLEALLWHIEQINSASVNAHTLIERLISAREGGQKNALSS